MAEVYAAAADLEGGVGNLVIEVVDAFHEVENLDIEVVDAFHEVENLDIEVVDVFHEVENLDIEVVDAFHEVENLDIEVADVFHEVENLDIEVADAFHEVRQPRHRGCRCLSRGWSTSTRRHRNLWSGRALGRHSACYDENAKVRIERLP